MCTFHRVFTLWIVIGKQCDILPIQSCWHLMWLLLSWLFNLWLMINTMIPLKRMHDYRISNFEPRNCQIPTRYLQHQFPHIPDLWVMHPQVVNDCTATRRRLFMHPLSSTIIVYFFGLHGAKKTQLCVCTWPPTCSFSTDCLWLLMWWLEYMNCSYSRQCGPTEWSGRRHSSNWLRGRIVGKV